MLPDIIDPRYTSFFLDTCAFDPKYAPEDQAAEELWKMHQVGIVALEMAHSNQREVDHPNTPPWVKQRALQMVFTIPVSLTPDEENVKSRIHDLLRGNAMSEKHKDDAEHLFEASKYGRYFVTTDQRVLARMAALYREFTIRVCRPSEIISRLDRGI